MTEDSRRPGDTPGHDDESGPEQRAAEVGSAEETANEADKAAGGQAPVADSVADTAAEPQHAPKAAQQSEGLAPPDAAEPADRLLVSGPSTEQPPPYDPGRAPRPGFVPHHGQGHDPQGVPPYGWNPQQQQHQQPAQHHQQPPQALRQPPPPSGPPVSTAPPPPPGALPLVPPVGAARPGFGGPGQAGPNWAPIPSPPSASRPGPGMGMFLVVALIVALVAGAAGAGIAVVTTGGGTSAGGIDLGGDSSGGEVKQRPPDSVAGVAQRVLPSVVMIKVASGTGESGAGTGFIVKGGYIITNNHVVSGAGQIQIVFNDKKTTRATIKGQDPSSDIAVLKPESTHGADALEVGNSDDLAVGDPVIAIGSPLGLQGSVTTGIVSSLNRPVPTRGENSSDPGSVLNAIQTDAAINPGNSGGPLVDATGKVIGINTAIATLGGGGLGGEGQSGSIGLGFAIPINQGKRVAEEIINTGSARRPLIGISMDTSFEGPGARIADQAQGGTQPLVKDGPADRAGLKPGDVITKFEGKPIENSADLVAMIRSKAPGDKVKVTYQRGGKETTVEVTLTVAN